MMLAGLEAIDENEQSKTIETTDSTSTSPHAADTHIPINSQSTTPINKSNHNGQTQLLSTDQTLRQIQQKRGLKRKTSRYIGHVVGDNVDIENCNESMITKLTPKKGKAKIDQKITQIRFIFNLYKEQKPEIDINHSFNFERAFIEFLYNLFHCIAYPLIIYNEGIAGFNSRQMAFLPALSAWFAIFFGNFSFLIADSRIKQAFWFPFFVMNLLTLNRYLVIATKYGYLPSLYRYEYNDSDTKISTDYIRSLHLVPGWIHQHPLAIARELYYTEKRLGIDLSKLRLNFRDTKAFNLANGTNCSCSRFYTMLDWFIPFIFVKANSSTSILNVGFFYFVIVFVLFMAYATIARMFEYSQSSQSALTFEECDAWCWTICVCFPVGLGWGLWSACYWSIAMAIDFNRRFLRMKLCTHILDPKRETFRGSDMRKTYKPHLFGSVSNIKMKRLKNVDLQTIDLYSADTIFAWSQFRSVLFDAGKGFLLREEAYNGFLVVSTLLTLFFFLYSLVSDGIVVVWEDLIITVLLCLFVLMPSMWTLSCANSLNYQTTKQQKILSERVVEMLHNEYVAKDKKMEYWVGEIEKARSMAEAVIDVLNQDEYSVTFLGIKVDNSIFQLIVTIIGILGYISAWIVYQNWIRE